MPKSSYPIPFDPITGDLVEWVDPDILTGKKDILQRWYDPAAHCFVSEPYKPWIRPFELREAYNERVLNWEKKELKPFQDLCASGVYVKRNSVDLVPNYLFQDTLRYKGYSRGRSSAKIVFVSESIKVSYGMFLTDFDDLMETVGLNALEGHGVNSVFTFVKRGQNYGVKLAG